MSNFEGELYLGNVCFHYSICLKSCLAYSFGMRGLEKSTMIVSCPIFLALKIVLLQFYVFFIFK
jgi:hypothetical protein